MGVPSNSVANTSDPVNPDQLNTYVQMCDTVDDLRGFIGVANQTIQLLGTASAGDGGQGTFYWNPTGTAPDDNGATTVIPSGSSVGNGEWVRLPSSGGLGTIPNNDIIANISGGAAIPIGNTLTAVIDSAIGGTQGGVLYRSATAWTLLPPGTVGQVLTTEGGAANPQWGNTAGTGTVTEVDTGSGLTGGPITSSGTVALAAVSTGNVLANITGGSAAPSANTVTAVLDAVFGTTQGAILYRGASTWSLLGPGTSGQFLETQGTSANPVWANPPTTSLPNALAVGSYVIATNNTGSTISANATTAGSNIIVIDTAGNSTGDTATGTWKTMQTLTPPHNNGLWQRVS